MSKEIAWTIRAVQNFDEIDTDGQRYIPEEVEILFQQGQKVGWLSLMVPSLALGSDIKGPTVVFCPANLIGIVLTTPDDSLESLYKEIVGGDLTKKKKK